MITSSNDLIEAIRNLEADKKNLLYLENIRTDFVTNSSSSSFILAKKPDLNEKQKEEILKYVESKFFGRPVLTPESTEEEILNVFEEDWAFDDEDTQQEVRQLLKEGKTVYSGSVCI